MKLIFALCFLTILLSVSQSGYSQKEFEILGVKYVFHTVKKSETIFSICQKYKVTPQDIQQANPELTAILQAGSTVKIPVGKLQAEPEKEKPLVSSIPTQAQDEDFYYHKTNKNQTIYSISKQYGITSTELTKLNPEIANGLILGQVLKIPVKKNGKNEEPLPINQTFTNYKVEKGETLFSLAARFGVEVSEIKNANPLLLSRSLEAGETIQIPSPINKGSIVVAQEPVSDSVPEILSSSKSGNCQPLTGKLNQKYKVGLLLPFNLSGSDQSTLDKNVLLSKISLNHQLLQNSNDTAAVLNGSNIDQKTEGFLEFYEGTLLAIDSLRRKGMNIEVNVFDASNAKTINALLLLDEMRDLDLIIGPVYPELQEPVASFAAKNRIPMVSPLSSSGNFEQNNSFYFKANPSREYQIEQTSEYISDEFSKKNFILLRLSGNSTSPEAKLGVLTKEKLSRKSGRNMFHEYNFQEQGVSSVKPLLNDSGENIFIIPTDNEAQVSVAVTNLTGLAEHYDIVLMGTPAFLKLKSIPTESYHRIRLRYLSPNFVDYNKPLVRRFVSTYRETFATEPTPFSFQGFDVSYYFLSALYRYGKDFRTCLSDYPMELTQMVFQFKKVKPLGGFMNTGLFVTSHERSFDVLNYGTFLAKPFSVEQ